MQVEDVNMLNVAQLKKAVEITKGEHDPARFAKMQEWMDNTNFKPTFKTADALDYFS